MVKNFVWRIHGELEKSSIKNYVVVRLLIEVIDESLYPNKDLPRLFEKFRVFKVADGRWMPIIHFSERNNAVSYKYIQGSHTAFCATYFADEKTTMCIMIRQNDLDLFRKFVGNEPFEVFTIEQYQNELPSHERKTYSDEIEIKKPFSIFD